MPKNTGGSGGWQHGLCGCFENCCLCALTYFVPCYVVGKVAEKAGESFCLHCCMTLIPIANLICETKIRGKIREQRGIDGSCFNDFCLHWFCAFCAIIQEAREIGACDKSMAEHPPEEIQRD